MTAPLRERLEDLLTRLDSPADRTLVQAAIRELAEREKDAERYAQLRSMLLEETAAVYFAAYKWKSGTDKDISPTEFDAAIDTAIKERK